jgi:hypothetical protein
LVTLAASSTQVRPQAWVPAGQLATHAPFMHTCDGGQAALQAPQLLGSDERSVQLPLQLAVPGHSWVQVPLAQAVPASQRTPMAPQLLELVARFTQAVVGPWSPKAGAGTRLPGQLVTQAAFSQT